jgi:excisionase family DNA binding protein
MIEALYTTNEAAELLEVTASRVRQMVIDGTIRAEKKGRDLLIPESEIKAARARKTKPGPAPRAVGAEKPAKNPSKKGATK